MRPFFPQLALAVALAFVVACNQKSEAALQAEEAAKVADAKVTQLEQQLAEAKSGKAIGEDSETAQHLTRSQVKALERQVSDAKKRAEIKRQEALTLAFPDCTFLRKEFFPTPAQIAQIYKQGAQ